MRGHLAKGIRKAARKLAELQMQIVEDRAYKWRQLPWWKRAWLRIRWTFTGEAR